MKKILILVLALFGGVLTAQNSGASGGTGASEILYNAGNPAINSYGNSMMFYNPKRQVDGTYYLFDKWDNYTTIHTEDNHKFVLRNINLNLERNTFESKTEGDSIFTFNFNNIDKFIINGRVFKNFFWDDDNKVYEIIFDTDDFEILKGFKVELIEGSANPMVNRKNDKYIRREYYFVRKDDKLEPFKFKKSRVLKLIGSDETVAKKIETYAKNNGLSFKKEKDVKKIFDYSTKI